MKAEKVTVKAPRKRVHTRRAHAGRRLRRNHNAYGVYSISQMFDAMANIEDLGILRKKLRAMADDDSLWAMLEQSQEITKTRDDLASDVEKRLRPYWKSK